MLRVRDSLCSTLPDAVAVNCVAKRCATSSTAREVSACDLLTCSWTIPSMDLAVCSAVASACSATFRVASVAAATWLTPDAEMMQSGQPIVPGAVPLSTLLGRPIVCVACPCLFQSVIARVAF